jgi:2-phospho-L-lactate/phosphoenolpyruvate guanylyltransferase
VTSAWGPEVLVPVKPLATALGRLRDVLDAPARHDLQEAMLADVLAACRTARGVGETWVITADPAAADLARRAGARALADHRPARGRDAAVHLGLVALSRAGARAAIVTFADVPLLRPEDLEALVAACPAASGVALAPSRDGTGTNALLLRPPDALRPALGPGSLARHLEAAARAGLEAALVHRPGLGLDVDEPADLAELWRRGPHGATLTACIRQRVGERLAEEALR